VVSIGTPVSLTKTECGLIRAHPLFSALEPEEFETLFRQCRGAMYRKNEMIFHAGDAADCFYIIARGTVRLFRLDANGDDVPVNIFQAPQSFAEAAVFREADYPVSAQALEETRLIRLAARPIVARIRSEPAFALGALESMSRHLKQLVDEIALLRTPTARQKVAKFLLKLSPDRNGGSRFDLPYSKLVIAERLGMKPETLSRAFADLRAVGVSVKRQTVTISNLANLWDVDQASAQSKLRNRGS